MDADVEQKETFDRRWIIIFFSIALAIACIIILIVSAQGAEARAYYDEPAQPTTISRNGYTFTVNDGENIATIEIVEYPAGMQRIDAINKRNNRNNKKIDLVLVDIPNLDGSIKFKFTGSGLKENCGYSSGHEYDENAVFKYVERYKCLPVITVGDLHIDFEDYTKGFNYTIKRQGSSIFLTLDFKKEQLIRNSGKYNLIIDPAFFSGGVCLIEGSYNDMATLITDCAGGASNRITCNAAGTCSSIISFVVGGFLNLSNTFLTLNLTSNGNLFWQVNASGHFNMTNSTLAGRSPFRAKFLVDKGNMTAYNVTLLAFGYSLINDFTAGLLFTNATLFMDRFWITTSLRQSIILEGNESNIIIANGSMRDGTNGIHLYANNMNGGVNNIIVKNIFCDNKNYCITGSGGNNNYFENVSEDGTKDIAAYFFGLYGANNNDTRRIVNLTVSGVSSNDSNLCSIDFGAFYGHNVLNSTLKDSSITGVCGQSIATRDNYGILFYSANGSTIINNTIMTIGKTPGTENFGIAVRTDTGTVPKEINIINNTINDMGNSTGADFNVGIWIVAGVNMTMSENYVNLIGHSSADTGYCLYLDIENSTTSYNNIKNCYTYGLIGVGKNNTLKYNNITTTRGECVISTFTGLLTINDTYDDCSNGGISIAYGAYTQTGQGNSVYINTKFLDGAGTGYSYYTYSTTAGSSFCFNCTFSQSIYVEDAQAFRVLEYWQAYVNTSGDTSLEDASVACINATGGGNVWTALTSSIGYTSRYNMTRLYYASYSFDTPTETWGDLNCTGTKASHYQSRLPVSWTHSYIIRDFWLNLTRIPSSSSADEDDEILFVLILLLAGFTGWFFFLRKRKKGGTP